MIDSRAAFCEELMGLSNQEFRAFISDLFAARGYAVQYRGDGVRVDDGSGESQVAIHDPEMTDWHPPTGTDIVATARPGAVETSAEVEALGPSAIFEQVKYALADEDRERLLQAHVGSGIEPSFEPSTQSARIAEDPGDEDAVVDRDPERSTLEDASVRVGSQADETESRTQSETVGRRPLLVAGGAFVGGLGLSGLLTWALPSASPETEDGDGTESATWSPPSPGLAPTGVADAGAAATAHVDALEATSYRLVARKRVEDGTGDLLSTVEVDAEVGANRAFLARIRTRGLEPSYVIGESPAEAAVWSDGERHARRLSNPVQESTTEYTPTGAVPEWYFWTNLVPYGGQPFSALYFYQTVFRRIPTAPIQVEGGGPVETRLVNTTDTLADPLAVFTRVPDRRPIDDLRLSASVELSGLVRDIRLGYGWTAENRRADATWMIRVEGVGETSVDRPDWVDTALQV